MLMRQSTYKVFPALFFFSGLAGLIYESVWAQYAKIVVGNAAYAQSLILVIFMLGLSVGAWLGGKLKGGSSKLLWYYGLAEAAIGLLALLFHPLFVSLNSAAATNASLTAWLMISSLTLPGALILGLSFPLIVTALQHHYYHKKAKIVARLYFINTLGAAVGVLAAGFFLIPRMGLPGTLITAGIINILIGFIALLSLKYDINKEIHYTPSLAKPSLKHPGLLQIILPAALFTGMASMIYELGWIRMLTMVLGSSAQAFELMLSAYLLGLALGAWWMAGRINKLKNLPGFLASVQIIMAVFALASLVVYDQSYFLMDLLLSRVSRDEFGYLVFNLASHTLAFMVMLPATFCAGTTLPLMISILQNKGCGKQAVARVYATNTLGAIAGIVAVHLAISLLGLKYLMISATVIDITLGIIILFSFKNINKNKNKIMLPTAIFILLGAIFFFKLDPIKMASGVFRYGTIDRYKTLLFDRDGQTATIAVSETAGGNIVLSTNGKPDASINIRGLASGDEACQTLLAVLPLSMNEKIQQIAIVGLGSGKTAQIALLGKNKPLVDVIEIEPAVAEAARYFQPYIENIYANPRFSLHIDDARSYLSKAQGRYELIISEPSNPWVSGMSALFSEQFYQIANSALTEEGMFVQWLHLYEMNNELLASVVKAFSPHFEDYHVYFLDDGDMVLIGKKQGKLSWPMSDIFSNPAMKMELDKLGIQSVADLRLRYTGDKALLDPYFHSFALAANNDFYPVLEYQAPKARFLDLSVDALQALLLFPAPILKTLGHFPPIPADSLGPDYAFSMSENYRLARQIYALTCDLQNGQPIDYSSLDTHDALLCRNIHSIADSGHSSAYIQSWHLYLDRFARVVMPFLDASQLNEIWNFIRQAPGYVHLSEDTKTDIALYQAAGNCDYSKILSLTPEIHFGENAAKTAHEKYRLIVNAWAKLMTGQGNPTIRPGDNPRDTQNPSAMMRFLKSYASSKQK